MVGVVTPNGSKAHPEERPSSGRSKSLAELPLQNPIQVRSPTVGAFSHRADEHCFSWISQTSRGRTLNDEPLCRAVCIRRVFAHEVRRLTPHFSYDAAIHRAQMVAAKRQLAEKSPSPLRYPLPVEGQPREQDDEEEEHPMWRNYGSPRPDPGKAENVRYWEEGWYIWMAKGRLAVQDHIDLMAFNIPEQTRRLAAKENEAESAWTAGGDVGVSDGVTDTRMSDGHATLETPDADGVRSFYYPAEESLLLHIPTSFPVSDWVQRVHAPTWSALALIRRTFESGDQQKLALHTWELARDGAPFRLVRNVFKTWRDAFRGGRESN